MNRDLDYVLNYMIKYTKHLYRLEEENKKLKEEYITLEKDYGTSEIENDKLRKRINKAIEYIDEVCLCSSGYCKYGDDLSPKHIVDILKGSEE